MASEGFLVREDDRTMSSLRRRNHMKRNVRRDEDDDNDSDDEREELGTQDSSSKMRIQTQIPSPESTSTTSGLVSSNTTSVVTTTKSSPSSTRQTTFITSSTLGTRVNSPTQASTNPTGTLISIPQIGPERAKEVSPTPSVQTRQHTTLSHAATIGLEFLGIAVGIIILLSIAYIIFKRVTNLRIKRKNDSSTPPPPQMTKNLILTSTSSSKEKENPFLDPSTTISPNPNPKQKQIVSPKSTYSSAIRTARLDRVRPDLLSSKELNGNIMRSHNRTMSARTVNPHDLPPRKAVLKRNTSGKMVMRSGVPSSPTLQTQTQLQEGRDLDRSREDDGRVTIEASGEWEDSRTITGGETNLQNNSTLLKPLAGLMALPKAKTNSNDPTLMSGGLRSSTRILSALNGLDNRGVGVPYQHQQPTTTAHTHEKREPAAASASEKESAVLGRPYSNVYEQIYGKAADGNEKNSPFADLPGLRQAEISDAEFEEERLMREMQRERMSLVSGTVRSTTSWNTGVWERLEGERVGLRGREGLEGGLGGGERSVGSRRESTATSVAVFRRPISWVRDQVERSNSGVAREGK